MDIEERRVEAADLEIGMVVCRLDRPWAGTPFALQGFPIQEEVQLQELRRLCRHVYIDVQRSRQQGQRSLLQRLGYGQLRKAGKPLPEPVEYPRAIEVSEELPSARKAWSVAETAARRLIDDVRAGRRLDGAQLTEAIEPIVASVIRNPDAYFWLEALRRRSDYAYSHAVNCCALAATFGRQLGFPREVLLDLAQAGMLFDIGKAAVPAQTYEHDGPLDASAQAMMRDHVEHSLRLIDEGCSGNEEVRLAVRHHHERHDGSGYPAGLAGPQIPLTGRMLGLVDSYDALCSDRPHQAALPRHDALQSLYRQRDRLYQSELVEQFSQCLGVYPTGSLVELSSGEVALVAAQNPARRLFPRVTVLTHSDKSVDWSFPQIDLWQRSQDSATRSWIARALAPGAYGLDPGEFFL